MTTLRSFVRPRSAAVAMALTVVLTALTPVAPAPANQPVTVRASETERSVDHGWTDFDVRSGTTHVAIHWTGNPTAQVRVRFSRDGSTFGTPQEVMLDEVGEARGDGETYGSVMVADGVRTVRVLANRKLDKVTVVSMDAGADVPVMPVGGVSAVTNAPTIIPRSGWGADERIRFDRLGDERWGRGFYPLQKMTIHHTAGSNYDPNPAATVRAVYHYQAVTQDWGDIGYNYLIDSAGRIYEGRYSRDYWNGATPTGDTGLGDGLVIAGGHALKHNAGNLGVAFLGTFDAVAPKPAAVDALVRLLAWAASTHGIDPRGSSTYVNPVSGITRYTPNIAGHRNYNQTGCPGAALYNMLPTIRARVADYMNPWPGELFNPPRRVEFQPGTHVGRAFSAAGAVVASKPFTLSTASSAPTVQRATIPNQPGTWLFISAGVWSGYWIQESAAAVLAAPAQGPAIEPYWPTRQLLLAAGTYVGRRFSSTGAIIGTRSGTVAAPSMTYTSQRVQIPGQTGWWYYVTAGTWSSYWIQESAGTTLAAPPPAWGTIATYNPDASLRFAPGTYVGHVFNAYGMLAYTKTYTLTTASSAPTSEQTTVPGQSGEWYYITVGVWAGMWIRETAGTTLQP